MKLFSKIADAARNVFYFKVVLLIFLIPTLLAPAVSFNYKILFVMLAWGALLCVYDLFTKRNFLRAPGMLWLLAFLLTFLVTVLLNYQTNFTGNFTGWCYTVIALLLIYPDHTGGDRTRVAKEIFVLNNVFIGMTAILSTISFGMFVCQYSQVLTYGGNKYYIGWCQNRLFGLYKNTGYMTSAIGLALITIQFTVMKVRNCGSSRRYKAFLIYTAAVNFLSMCLENAKGAFISLAAFAAVFGFFCAIRHFASKGLVKVRSFLISGVIGALSAALLLGCIYSLRPLLAYIPAVYETIISEDVTFDDLDELGQMDIDRDIPDSYGALTGRPTIWKFGIAQFLEKPLFGYGANSHNQYKIVDIGLSHFHNLIVQSLVSVGIIGSLFIGIFFIKRLIKSLAAIWKRRADDDSYMPLIMAIFSMLVMFLVNSMAEVTVLFVTRFTMFLFWMMLGYMTTLLSCDNKAKEDCFADKMADSIDAKLIRADSDEK